MVLSMRMRNSTLFFLAYLLSAFGYEFIFFVMTLHVFDLSHSALNVAWFTALTFLPRLMAPVLGIAADLHNKEKLFAFSLGLTGLFIFILGFVDTIAYIYGIWFFVSLFITLTSNVRTAIMTIVMPRDSYIKGNSAVLVSMNGAKLLAPLIGGFIISLYSTRLLLFFTAVIYLLAMLLAFILDLPSLPIIRKSQPILEQVGNGLHNLWDNPVLRFLLTLSFAWRLFLGLQVSLFVVYIKDYLAGSDAQYGVFMMVIGVASLLGSLVGPLLLRGGVSRESLVKWGVSINFASIVFLGLTHSFWLASIAIFIGFLFFYAAVVALHSLRDQYTEIEVRGRVYGTVTALLCIATIISMIAGGVLAPLLGAEKVLMGGAILAGTAVVLTPNNKALKKGPVNQRSNF